MRPPLSLFVRRLSSATSSRSSGSFLLPPLDQRRTLPPPSQWKKHWNTIQSAIRDRSSVSNPATAALLADSLVPEGSKDKVIIEAFPGQFIAVATRHT
jgi:transcription factor 1